MIRQLNKLGLAVVTGGMMLISTASAEAGCHGRSGGGYYGSSYSSRISYSRAVYSSPVYSQPVYAQPVYSQPAYPQPGYGPSQTVYGQAQPLPQFGGSQPGYPAPQGFPAAGSAGSVPSGQFGNSPMTSSPGTQMVPGQSQLSAGQSQPTSAQSQMVVGGPAAPGTSAGQNGGVQIPDNSSPVNASPIDAQQSALQALGGFAPPQTATVAPAASASPVQTTQPSFAGTWTANLANGARIQLSLQTDGRLAWTAVYRDGQSSVFQGTYAIENGSLSLTRNNDSQKLSGSVTTTGTNAFNFRLSADSSSGIDFVRG